VSVVHLINHADFGQVQIDDPEYVRVDRVDDCEFYVTIIHNDFEEFAWSLHTGAADAEDSAARLASRASIVGLTFHDLRGSAVVRLAIAEATVPQIATFTGHSLRDVEAILDAHYLGRDVKLAEIAVMKLETRTKL
jgi:hypothetical protein